MSIWKKLPILISYGNEWAFLDLYLTTFNVSTYSLLLRHLQLCIFLRGDDATFEDISGTLFFLWFFYGFKWKFRANLLQGTHRNGFFCSKKPLFDFFKKKSPFQGVTMKNRKMGQNLTFCVRNVSKLGQNIVCT